jgi:hypothetical protein
MLNCLSISINYSDCFEVIAKHNRIFFKEWYVGTISTDKKTIEICKENNINVVYCDDVLNKNDAIFNKGAMINKVYSHINNKEWLLHLDSDILLPHEFYFISGNTHILQKENLYGMHRWQIHSKSDAYDYIKTKIHPHSTRLYEQCGIGYFQLFHNSVLNKRKFFYTETSRNAGWTDNEFIEYFKGNVRYIEHFNCYHLGQQGINWNGRISNTLR